MNSVNLEPCLVETGQGFTVKYKEKFLYSKYNPSKNVINSVNSLSILPGTLVLAFSPVLCYGILELVQKLPENCLILAVEFDDELYDFSKKYIDSAILKSDGKFQILSKKDILNFHNILQQKSAVLQNGFKFPEAGTFKRVVKLDFSAGTQFFHNFYQEFLQVCVNSIQTFFINRITLTKFGRKYSYNLFRNLINLPDSIDVKKIFKIIEKPILILGTGKSVLNTLKEIRNCSEKFFIISLDATLKILQSFNIKPDLVVCEESQKIISKMFIGSKNVSKIVIAGLTSASDTVEITSENISYFVPEFYDSFYFNKLKNISNFPEFINPLGSVGITALFFALKIRKTEDVKIFISGLDFSFDKTFTHAKNSVPYFNIMLNQNKLNPIQNNCSVFSKTNLQIIDKNQDELLSSKNLLNYFKIFEYFTSQKNIFDIRSCGIDLNLKDGKNEFDKILNIESAKKKEIDFSELKFSSIQKEKIKNDIKNYFESEIKDLNFAKKILTNSVKITKERADDELEKILKPKDYLYLHFPDGFKFSLELSFLKRISTEIDFFLKEFKNILKIL